MEELPRAHGGFKLIGKDTLRNDGKPEVVKFASDYQAFIDPFFLSEVHLVFTRGLSTAVMIAASIRGLFSEEDATPRRFLHEARKFGYYAATTADGVYSMSRYVLRTHLFLHTHSRATCSIHVYVSFPAPTFSNSPRCNMVSPQFFQRRLR
ncbi:hypothetical protein AZE42_10048 [Rhizopogon vesiculosus]|uniref:Uncharacterized protein n=1 Tax=Rhizopogon vesiculosus TaxID=180088 RepID=A0A1J8QDR9_9AGAM|nr:hypothetical protein AZE42_10048 [Rhizopogon vesiculosus]